VGMSQKVSELFHEKEDISISEWANQGFSISKGLR
jgi:hypothetical protein